MASRIADGVRRRVRWAELGVWFLRTRDLRPDSVRVLGRRTINFPDGERAAGLWEIGLIHFEDCYGLRHTTRPHSIVDVGANVGLFSLVARNRWRSARIHAYEPNPALRPFLDVNLKATGVEVYSEAVGRNAGMVNLVSDAKGSMHSTVGLSPAGDVPQIDFGSVVERLGGAVDLLKLDCEGAEWEILKSPAIGAVRDITMEFHLWAKPQSTVEEVIDLVRSSGFQVLSLNKVPSHEWGLLRATRGRQKP